MSNASNVATFVKSGGVVPSYVSSDPAVPARRPVPGTHAKLSTATKEATWLAALELAVNPGGYPDQRTEEHIRKDASIWGITSDVDAVFTTVKRASSCNDTRFALEIKGRDGSVVERLFPLHEIKTAAACLLRERTRLRLEHVKSAALRILGAPGAEVLDAGTVERLQKQAGLGIGNAADIHVAMHDRLSRIGLVGPELKEAAEAITKAASRANDPAAMWKVAETIEAFDIEARLTGSYATGLRLPEDVCFGRPLEQLKQAAADILEIAGQNYSRTKLASVTFADISEVNTGLADACRARGHEQDAIDFEILAKQAQTLSGRQQKRLARALEGAKADE